MDTTNKNTGTTFLINRVTCFAQNTNSTTRRAPTSRTFAVVRGLRCYSSALKTQCARTRPTPIIFNYIWIPTITHGAPPTTLHYTHTHTLTLW
jgi:hypothetical protein